MPQLQTRPIRQLPPGIVNKIAAGEVIERPASVVKELLENSVDAGATHIEVALENGGIDSIRIVDDGHGIPLDQLELAVTSHATSKIEAADDLFRVHTFGFRGEALASIAEVSQFSLRSRTADQDCGYELIVHGGHRETAQPIGMPVGTQIRVENLFYNTPVRRKFLRTPQTERGHIVEAFARVALANPQIHLTLTHGSNTLYDLPSTESWHERITTFYGPEIGEALIPVHSNHGDVQLSGYVVDPSVSRGNNRMQYLFLNGRYIRDRSLQHALSEAYRGLLMTGRYPIVFLRMTMPPELVDVNVHPAKLEVRFQNGGQLYSQLLGTLREKFLSSDLTAKAHLSRPQERVQTPGGAAGTLPSPAPGSGASGFQQRMELPNPSTPIDWTSAPRQQLQQQFRDSSSDPLAPPSSPLPAGPVETSDSLQGLGNAPLVGPGDPAPANRSVVGSQAFRRPLALQVHNTYLISETEEGMVVIDQHALHERIIYEQLRNKVLGGKLETQRLLVPEPVTLPPAEASAVLEQRELLAQIGMQIEPFGGDTVLITAYPAMLANQNPAETLRGIVDLLMAEGRTLDARDMVDELLHMISCKAAVKAGDKLTPEEIDDLLLHRDLCQDAHHCPHGRPTALVFSRDELDRRFKRI